MRAVLQYGIQDVRLSDLPRPEPRPGEVLLRIRAVTICASDVHTYAEGNVGGISWDRPFVPGHEAAALVEDPNGAGFAAGEPVVFDPLLPCRACRECVVGNYHLCLNQKFCDLPPIDGAMQEFLTWPAFQVHAVPGSIELVEAPLMEPLCVGVHATELPGDLHGASVLIAGAGAIGLFTLQMARVRGAKAILVSDLIPERLALAKQLGADETVRIDEADPVATAHALSGGRGVDVAFEAAGPLEAVQQCLDAVRPGGQVVVIGIPSVDEYLLSSSPLRRRELTIRFCRRQNENYPEALSLVREGRVRLGPLLTHRFPVERVKEAFDLAHRKAHGAVRVAVVFD